MADTKASQLEELAYTALVADDDFIVVDASDTSMAASGTTKRVSLIDTGTWTPAITIGGSGTGIVHSVQSANYWRVTGLCFITCDVRLSSKGSNSGSVRIDGLPFPALGNRICAWIRWTNLATAIISAYALTTSTTTALTLNRLTAAATSYPNTALTDTDLTDSTIFLFTGFYRVNA